MVRQNDLASETRGEYAKRIDFVNRAVVTMSNDILPWSTILLMQWHQERNDLGKDLWCDRPTRMAHVTIVAIRCRVRRCRRRWLCLFVKLTRFAYSAADVFGSGVLLA